MDFIAQKILCSGFMINMKVNSVSYSNNNSINCCGSKFSRLVENLSMRDFYADTKGLEFRELRQIYNRLWKNLCLPENLKPRIQYRAMLSNMSFQNP